LARKAAYLKKIRMPTHLAAYWYLWGSDRIRSWALLQTVFSVL